MANLSAAGSLTKGVMSLNTMPGLGKSGISRIFVRILSMKGRQDYSECIAQDSINKCSYLFLDS